MYVLLSELRDLFDAVKLEGIPEIWVQDDITIKQVGSSTVTSAVTCTAQSRDRVLIWRGAVETAGLRMPTTAGDIVDAVRVRLDQALQIVAIALHNEVPDATLRKGMLLQPGLFAELPHLKGEQHIWRVDQRGGRSTRTIARRFDEPPSGVLPGGSV